VKNRIPKRFLPVMTGLCLLLAGRMSAQTFSVLHVFSQTATKSQDYYTNSDGSFPTTRLLFQAATNLALPSLNNVDGPSPRTNALSGPQMFYQLKQEAKESPL